MPTKEKPQSLPGLGQKKVPAIETAAEDYVTKRDARMAALKLEVAAKKELTDLMHKENLTVYEYEGQKVIDGADDPVEVPRTVEIKKTEKLKVKTGDAEGDEPEEEDAE